MARGISYPSSFFVLPGLMTRQRRPVSKTPDDP
jgi:hypothetical protein